MNGLLPTLVDVNQKLFLISKVATQTKIQQRNSNCSLTRASYRTHTLIINLIRRNIRAGSKGLGLEETVGAGGAGDGDDARPVSYQPTAVPPSY